MKESKIKSIKFARKQTYDITIKKNHNFFCNNHLIHNCNYTGEIKIILINLSNSHQTILIGDRIAQAVICPVIQGAELEYKRVDTLEKTDRNDSGFGSTGEK